MTNHMNRRALIRGATWVAPAAVVATTAPAVAASQAECLLGYTQIVVRADTCCSNRIRIRTRLSALGDRTVSGIVLTVTNNRNDASVVVEVPDIQAGGVSDFIDIVFYDMPREPLTFWLVATADGSEPLYASASFNPPGWWSPAGAAPATARVAGDES